ncbi:rhomboid family intramembrane serine protease [Winogradskyella sp. PG-2]|uniref:rhomboid family intramembrane serine protease n=1 Tax=Winogradskyella sp. PG-2 TaxID=754409 RepID=UPI0004585C8F|nr:rhomboid family intramembrane serine protease [Winogradskyella sp. PG-2]BAO77079.1 possible Rhomboid family protein [Winogradskyella sp. PG-2]
MYNLSLVTIAIIAANVIFSMKGFDDRLFFEKYKFNIGNIRRGEQIRMFSSGFLHVDTQHLLFNMLTLYFFADAVIIELGEINFVIIYLASLVFGNLLSLYFHKEEYWYSAVGASGAVTGILYAAILLRPDMSLYMFFVPIPIPGYIFGIGYLAYSIYGMKNRIGNIGHDAHFGGAVGGYVVTLLLMPSLFKTDLGHIGLLAIPIVALFVLYKTGKLNKNK